MFSPDTLFHIVFLHLQNLDACRGSNINFAIDFIMGLSGILYMRCLHGQDLAAGAVGVKESESNLVDVIGHVLFICCSHISNPF